MTIRLPELDDLVEQVCQIRNYTHRRPYYDRQRVSGELEALADALNEYRARQVTARPLAGPGVQ